MDLPFGTPPAYQDVCMSSFPRLALVAVLGVPLSAQISVSLSASIASPAPLGAVVTWTATATDTNPGTLWYRFRARPSGGAFRTVVDYGPNASLNWATIAHEGTYEIEVSVENSATGETAATSQLFDYKPLAPDDVPVITPTANPLVFIYSAPPCAAGSEIRVRFEAAGGHHIHNTPYQACDPALTSNFYVAGMRADSQYNAWYSIKTGRGATDGAVLPIQTSNIGLGTPQCSVFDRPGSPEVDGVLLQSLFGTSAIATDLNCNIIWYSPSDITFLTRPQAGGTFLAIGEDGTKDPSQQFFREFDLAGITLAETNAARVNQELAAMGVHPINAFHHEARKLPDGSYLVLADSERILTNVQGPGPVDVIGDTILIFDSNLQVTWAWDAFDHLDPARAAILGETCVPASGLACAPYYLSTTANDWLHGNSLELTPDGNILYSTRHQDWLVKIDYENGRGTGDILWRLGAGGDFQIESTDPYPWFSHQHDANIVRTASSRSRTASAGETLLTVFDDGNTRAVTEPNADSRGQVLRLDETNHTATLLLNADLGTYSPAVGSAQILPNGDYHFDSGFIADPSNSADQYSQSVEVNGLGGIVYGIQFGVAEYRTFRMVDMYTP
jgi:arylsulfate sulfotransferase